jgi:hypothetical protein
MQNNTPSPVLTKQQRSVLRFPEHNYARGLAAIEGQLLRWRKSLVYDSRQPQNSELCLRVGVIPK